jgi:hypothetical protein
MPAADVDLLSGLRRRGGADRLDHVIDMTERAESAGLLDGSRPPGAAAGAHAPGRARVATARTRLWLLGYLPADSESPDLDPALAAALGGFQRDAGIVESGLGGKTWEALDELASFENPAHMERWVGQSKRTPALLRAVAVRLRVLGFLPPDTRPPLARAVLDPGLRRFVDLVNFLGLPDRPLVPTYRLETLHALFDQDGLVERLARPRGRPALSSQDRQRVSRFFICMAKIELWLLGLDVRPDGRDDFPVPSHQPYGPERFPLFHALRSFWLHRGRLDNRDWPEVRARAGAITAELFAELAAMAQESQAEDQQGGMQRLYKRINGLEQPDQMVIWEHIRAGDPGGAPAGAPGTAAVRPIRSRLWDGIRRAWRWFLSIAHKVRLRMQQFVAWARNLARLVHHHAVGAFRELRAVIDALRSAVGTLFATRPVFDPPHLVIRRDGDLDQIIYLDAAADPARVYARAAELRRDARLFRLGVLLLTRLVELLLDTLRPGRLGWFGLLLALVRINHHARALAAAVRALLAATAAPVALPARLA